MRSSSAFCMRKFKKSWCTRSVGFRISALPLRKSCRCCLGIAPALEGRIFKTKPGNLAISGQSDFSDDLLQAYYREVLRKVLALVKDLGAFYQDLQVRGRAGIDHLWAFLRLIQEHFRKNHLPNLTKQLETLWFPHFTCGWSLMRS